MIDCPSAYTLSPIYWCLSEEGRRDWQDWQQCHPLLPASIAPKWVMALDEWEWSESLTLAGALSTDPLGILTFLYDATPTNATLFLAEQVRLTLQPVNYLPYREMLERLFVLAGWEIVATASMAQTEKTAAVMWQLRKVLRRYRVVKMQLSDFKKISELFNAAFHQSLNEKWWQWKYQQGLGVCVVNATGEIVAHSGSFIRQVHYHGQQTLSYQIGDNMVLPADRGYFGRHNPFYLAVSAQLLLAQAQGIAVGFGFPNLRAYKIGERLGLYQHSGYLATYQELPKTLPKTTDLYWQHYDSKNTLTSATQQAIKQALEYREQALPQAIALLVDWSTFTARYLNHPLYVYNITLVYKKCWWHQHKLLGMLVWRESEDGVYLMLVAALPKHYEKLVNVLKQYAFEQQLPLNAWGHIEVLQKYGFSLQYIQAEVLHIPASKIYPLEPLSCFINQWHLEYGDTDFM